MPDTSPHALIVSSPEDGTGLHIADTLQRRGCRCSFLDTSSFPSSSTITYRKGARSVASIRAPQLGELRRYDAIVYRPYKDVEAPAEVRDERIARYVIGESRRFLHDLWATLECVWFPAAPSLIGRAQNKLLQLAIAEELGLATPATLVTNDPLEALDFWHEHRGAVVSKMPSETFGKLFGLEQARYTEPVTHWQLGAIDSVRLCPVLLQARVDKRRELRVTVVGERLFAVAIHSQETNRTRGDWRRYDLAATRHEAVELPPTIHAACLAITRRLGLAYGAIDLIETPENEHVFLEINPAGQWGWLEGACELPITDAVATLILEAVARHGQKQQQEQDGAHV
jgi:hypothetical protein